MVRLLIILTSLFLTVSLLFSQDHYLPYNVKNAYTKKQTRDLSGNPGINYFQNSADYRINCSFNPQTGLLKGEANMTYFNNSPDSLYYLVFRLYHNVLKKGAIRDEEIPEENLTSGVNIKSLKIDGDQYTQGQNGFFQIIGTNLFVGLNYYIKPQKTASIEIEWETELPESHVHRFGGYGTGNWFVAYWYPQIAVYDDISGWDTENYTGQYEFYNNHNNFDITLSVPANYLVRATGTWENPQEILKPEILERYNRSASSDAPVSIIQATDWKNRSVFQKGKVLNYHFTCDSITDFAFAVTGDYLWNAGSVVVDSSSGSRTRLSVLYPENIPDFSALTSIGLKSIHHISYQSLGITYPYNDVTIYNGGGGMEFPMMVNMRHVASEENIFTAIHEIFHAYFPFYTGTNERDYAWLDEGLTSYLPIETEAHVSNNPYFPLHRPLFSYNEMSGNQKEVPLFIPSSATRNLSYYHQAYFRSTVAFGVIEQHIGREAFRGAVREFTKRWALKHPTGYDFIFTLYDYIKEDISWLVEPWFFGNGWADVGIKDVSITKDGYFVAIKNYGGLPVRVELRVVPEDGETYIIKKAADIWKNKSVTYVTIPGNTKLKRLELSNYNIPDKDSDNNYFFFID